MSTYRILTEPDKREAKRAIDKLREGKRFDVTIKAYHPKRSIPQNRTYWMWIGCIHNETGENQQSVHLYLRKAFLGMSTFEAFGVVIEEPRSTTTLSTADFSAYMEKVQAWAATDLAIRLPNPEELAWAEFYERYGEHHG